MSEYYVIALNAAATVAPRRRKGWRLSKLRPQPHQSKRLKLLLSAHLQQNFLRLLPVVVRATTAAMNPRHNQGRDAGLPTN